MYTRSSLREERRRNIKKRLGARAERPMREINIIETIRSSLRSANLHAAVGEKGSTGLAVEDPDLVGDWRGRRGRGIRVRGVMVRGGVVLPVVMLGEIA